MSSETAQSKVQAFSQQQTQQSLLHCPISNAHTDRKEAERIYQECRNESFWYRGLPLSLGSMLIAQGLIYNGFLLSNPRFGSLPKIAHDKLYYMTYSSKDLAIPYDYYHKFSTRLSFLVAGVFGFGIGTMSYIRICQSKFQSIRVQPFDPENKRHCHHTCKECEVKFGSNGMENSKPPAS